MKKQKQLVNFVQQVAVIECECYKKHGKGNVLFTKFFKDIAHRFGHDRKRSGSMCLIVFGECIQRRVSVIAAEVKVFCPAPLNNDLEGFNIIHGRFNLMMIAKKWMITG